MPSLPLVGFTTYSQRDKDNRFYCVAGAQKDCRATIPTDIPETPATYIKVLEGQAPPTNSGLSTDAKAGIVVNIAIALILTLGIGVAVFLLYRRSRQSRCQDTEVNGTSGCKAEELASERVIPEMDAIHSERRAELDGTVISELFGGTMSRTAAEGWIMIAAERQSVHEMGA